MGNGAQVAWAPMGRLLWSSADASAPIAVLGVPLDETTSFRPGARFGPSRLYQLGIRSADKSELDGSEGMSEIHFCHVLEPLRSVISRVQDRPIYLSIDIDVVDPAFAPGTGVPEPGAKGTSGI